MSTTPPHVPVVDLAVDDSFSAQRSARRAIEHMDVANRLAAYFDEVRSRALQESLNNEHRPTDGPRSARALLGRLFATQMCCRGSVARLASGGA
jgi:hypothetical protein